MNQDAATLFANAFSIAYPIGTRVRYWTGPREGEGTLSAIRSEARIIGSTPVVWVDGHGSCISLSHIEILNDNTVELVGLEDKRCCMATRDEFRVFFEREGWQHHQGCLNISRMTKGTKRGELTIRHTGYVQWGNFSYQITTLGHALKVANQFAECEFIGGWAE